jgi:NitT/TauT family transport system substrate-binding protein
MRWTCARWRHARRRTRATGLLVLLCCSAGVLAAEAPEKLPVRVGLTRETANAPFLVALDAGDFQAGGLAPEVRFFKTDALVSLAVASGKVDIGMASLSAPFFSAAAGRGLKAIASRSSDQTGLPMYVLLFSQKARAAGLTGVRGLPNARIGVAGADSGAYYALFSIASRFKLDPGSIKTVPLKSPGGELAALARGDIDAALLPFPTALPLAKDGRSMLRLSDFAQWQEGVVFTTGDNIAKRRDLVERFVRAYQHGTADYQLNFLNYDDGGDFIPGPQYEKYLASLARTLKVAPDFLAKTKTYCDRRANLDVADVGKQVQFWQAQGRLDKGVAATEVLDVSFIGEETVSPRSGPPAKGGAVDAQN